MSYTLSGRGLEGAGEGGRLNLSIPCTVFGARYNASEIEAIIQLWGAVAPVVPDSDRSIHISSPGFGVGRAVRASSSGNSSAPGAAAIDESAEEAAVARIAKSVARIFLRMLREANANELTLLVAVQRLSVANKMLASV